MLDVSAQRPAARGFRFDSPRTSGNYWLYATTDVTAGADDFVTQANVRGPRGFKFATGFFFNDGGRSSYVEDTAQSASFSYKASVTVNPGAVLVAQANAEGQLNFVDAGGLIFFPNGQAGAQQPRNTYVNPVCCAVWVTSSAGARSNGGDTAARE